MSSLSSQQEVSVVFVFVVDYGFCFYCAALAVLHYDRDALCGHPDSLLQLGPTGYAYVQKSLICLEQGLVVVMDWENNCMTGMMVNFLFLRLHTHHHHHHPACGGDVLVLSYVI
jgi:hypothetical protein